ncbi:BnaAnng41050D [Brassica napus]|uniref:BnaAnng41050D protein n=1 Tax=Brassica napus TaxID=3708 RepID=A0A078K133_BRANA|nr:BnaAnng41050D [Brassica napus]
MKKQKQCVSKEETRIISSTTSTKASGENSGQIPIDIILEILSRVPAKSIARFRCASKDWGVTLCRPYFTDQFIKMSSLSPCLLFTFHAEDRKSSRVAVHRLSHIPIDYPIRVCVPACGLLCTKDEWDLSGKKDARMMICNPSTGGFKLLPKVKTKRRRVLTYLGYDPVEKVLTLGTGNMNWRMIECSVSHCPQSKDNEICIGGVLYYLAVGSGSWETSMPMIVCFDIRSEKFKFIVDEAFKDINYPSSLINYKGKLGILHPNSDFMAGRSSGFVLWVIDDIENHTWRKNIIILPSLWWSLVAGTRFHIVGTTGDSEIMFSPSVVSSILFYIFCYNMETKSMRRVEIQGLGPVKDQKIYTFLNHIENVKLVT